MGPKKTQKDTSMDESAGISRSSDQDTLTELLKTLVTTMSKGQEDMANLMKKTLNKESMTQEEYRVETERSEKQKRSERNLTKIADIKDGDDPEVYLESLKNKLIQANVPQDEWKLLLISHLTGKYLVMIQDIEADPGYGFEEVQSRILDCCGLTSTMAGQQFHKFQAVDAKDMGTAQLIQTLKRLITKVLKGSQTIDEAIELLLISKVRYVMSSRGKQFLDGRTPKTESDLREALQCWESTERSICEERPVWNRPKLQTSTSSNKCFNCGEAGHMARQCPNAMDSSKSSESSSGKKDIVCHACSKTGHKVFSCSNRSVSKKELDDKSRRKDGKAVKGVTTADEVKKDINILTGTVAGKELPFILDSGARITMMPSEMVGEAYYTGQVTLVKDANGGTTERELARVTIEIGGQVRKELVALAKGDVNGEKGLLSIDLESDKDFQLVELFRKKRKEVLAVETRNQKKEKLREQNEKLSIVSENEDKSEKTEEAMELPCLEKGFDRNDFIQEIKSDISLGTCRELADRKQKVVHINYVKRYVEREECVQALTVVAEEVQEDSKVKLRVEKCEGFNEEELERVLVESKEILVDKPGETGVVMIDIELEPGTRVISQRPYRIPEKMKEGVRKEIEDMLEGGIIEESESAWSSPIVPVLKPNGAIRVCVDYRKLNACTPQTQCYIPTLDDILDDVGQAKVLSKLDLTKGFYQVRLAPRAKDLTTFISPFGKYRFKRMPFGLKMLRQYFRL